MKNLLCLTGILLYTITTVYAQNCNLNEDARRYFVRANVAIKEAKNDTDYLNAVDEFKKALQFAPDCSDIYYNIAVCYEKAFSSDILNCIKSIEYYNKYLELKPNAQDKQTIQNKIYELEYKYDKYIDQIKKKEGEPEMIFVQGGTFQMGCRSYGCEKDEKPVHKVSVSSFYIGKYEVTQGQWKAFMGNNPSSFSTGDNYPVENVSWNDVKEFISRINISTGKQYRLPTEAEWEFAARGGNKSKEFNYSGSDKAVNVAWYKKNSFTTQTVGMNSPNELGIYDMSGNVNEWCSDWYDNYSKSSQINPTGPSSGSNRVYRGGSWSDDVRSLRVSNRNHNATDYHSNNIGFRLACDSK